VQMHHAPCTLPSHSIQLLEPRRVTNNQLRCRHAPEHLCCCVHIPRSRFKVPVEHVGGVPRVLHVLECCHQLLQLHPSSVGIHSSCVAHWVDVSANNANGMQPLLPCTFRPQRYSPKPNRDLLASAVGAPAKTAVRCARFMDCTGAPTPPRIAIDRSIDHRHHMWLFLAGGPTLAATAASAPHASITCSSVATILRAGLPEIFDENE
jgi:hypothetical protein